MTWYNSIPAAVREPIRSALVSMTFAIQTAVLTLIGAASVEGRAGSPEALWAYVTTHWWGVALGLILPAAYRAQQGFKAATQVVSTSSSVSVPQPAPPAKVVAVDTVTTTAQKGSP